MTKKKRRRRRSLGGPQADGLELKTRIANVPKGRAPF